MACSLIVRGGTSCVVPVDERWHEDRHRTWRGCRAIYSEAIDLAALGSPVITRASHVEPDQDGLWWADLSPVGGPSLGPYRHRSQALAAEVEWLEDNFL